MADDGNYTPADAAEYLEGPMPRYAPGTVWLINGEEVHPNKLQNPFDPQPEASPPEPEASPPPHSARLAPAPESRRESSLRSLMCHSRRIVGSDT